MKESLKSYGTLGIMFHAHADSGGDVQKFLECLCLQLVNKLRRNKLEQHNGFMRKQLQSQNLFKIPVPVCGFFAKNENNSLCPRLHLAAIFVQPTPW